MRLFKPILHFSKLHQFFIAVMLILISTLQIEAQKVTGTITDESGGTLIGVTVMVKGTGTGTISDLDGKYSIAASQGQVLEFAMVGMETKEITVGTSNVIDVVLSGSVLLESVEIVGALGIVQDKRKLAYSAQGVSGAELINTQRNNAFVALGSRIAGLTLTPTSGLAGGSVNINLRGVNSIGNSNQPLLVMDGLPISSSTFSTKTLFSDASGVNGNINNNRDDVGSRLAEINPNDIESITVLKGPEAAALYGNEGANGVIIITTKKGKAGSSKITYGNRFSTSELYRFNEIQQVYGRGKNGGVDVNDPDYFGPKFGDTTQLYNNLENFFQRGSSMRHDLAIEGGATGFTYRLSGAYIKDKGNIPTNEYNQLNLSASTELKLNSWLKATSRFAISQNKNIMPPGGSQGYLLGTLRYPSNFDMTNYLTPEGNRTLTLPNSTYGTDSENAYFNVNKNIREENTNRTVGNISLVADVTKKWNITGRMGSDIYTTSANRFFHPQSNVGFSKGGWIENYVDYGRILNGTLLNTYKTKLGNIGATFLIGTSVDDRRNEISNDYGEKLYLPDYNSINNTDPITQRNRPTILRSRLIGLFGEAKFDYNDWLFFNVSGRNDWSSTLPIQNRSYFYPSAGVAINFTDIPSLQGSFGPLSFGKIRFSYANVGNPAKPYAVRSRLVSQTSTGGGFLYDFYGDNPSLKPENVVSYEVGTELGFFNDRLTLDLALYSKSITDQIVTQRLSYGTGFIFGLLNGGDLNTKGVDLQLGGTPIRSQNLTWKINANFTKYKTVVNNLPADVNEYYDSDTWVYGNVRSAGFAPAEVLAARLNKEGSAPFFYSDLNSRGAGSATAISGLSYQRNSNGDILINPTTGFPISNPNFLPIGDRVPDFTIGLFNQFTIMKNLDISFLLDIRKGGDIFNGNEMYLTQIGLSKRTLDRDEPIVIKGVLKDGKEESETPTANTKEIIPSANDLYYSAVLQPEEFIERDINWLRLRDITVRYQLPSTLFKKMKAIKDASVFINGTDLFLITNYTGADPFVSATNSATGGSGGFGMDFGKTSLPRTFSAGLSVTF